MSTATLLRWVRSRLVNDQCAPPRRHKATALAARRRRLPRLEPLEGRVLLATVMVNSDCGQVVPGHDGDGRDRAAGTRSACAMPSTSPTTPPARIPSSCSDTRRTAWTRSTTTGTGRTGCRRSPARSPSRATGPRSRRSGGPEFPLLLRVQPAVRRPGDRQPDFAVPDAAGRVWPRAAIATMAEAAWGRAGPSSTRGHWCLDGVLSTNNTAQGGSFWCLRRRMPGPGSVQDSVRATAGGRFGGPLPVQPWISRSRRVGPRGPGCRRSTTSVQSSAGRFRRRRRRTGYLNGRLRRWRRRRRPTIPWTGSSATAGSAAAAGLLTYQIGPRHEAGAPAWVGRSFNRRRQRDRRELDSHEQRGPRRRRCKLPGGLSSP